MSERKEQAKTVFEEMKRIFKTQVSMTWEQHEQFAVAFKDIDEAIESWVIKSEDTVDGEAEVNQGQIVQ